MAPRLLALLSDPPTCHNQTALCWLTSPVQVRFLHTHLDEVCWAAWLLTDVLPPAGVTSWLMGERRSLRVHIHVLQDETGGSEHWLLLLLVQLLSCYLCVEKFCNRCFNFNTGLCSSLPASGERSPPLRLLRSLSSV